MIKKLATQAKLALLATKATKAALVVQKKRIVQAVLAKPMPPVMKMAKAAQRGS